MAVNTGMRKPETGMIRKGHTSFFFLTDGNKLSITTSVEILDLWLR
ncbi:UNVERIFIED_CONTAM: hypothetical protein GTU68_038729 [Idotea baltica]|nr:hypothetical protein [Idotea baltica]